MTTNNEQRESNLHNVDFAKMMPKLRFKEFDNAWQIKKIKDIANVKTGGTPSTKIYDYWNPSEIDWMASGEINKRYIFNTDKKISKKGLQESSAKIVKNNSVLIALAGQGKTRAKVAINKKEIAINQSLAAIELNDNYNYLFVFFNLDKRYLELRNLSSGNSGRGGLNKKLVNNVTINIPNNIQEQQKIGAFFEKIDRLIALNEQKLDLLKKKKQGYLQKLFPQAGQTTPQLRFKGFNEEWQTIKLSNIYQKSKEKNTKLTFNQKQIISVASMHFNNDTDAINSIDDYMKTYNVMHLGDIAFEGNKSKKFFGGRFVLNDIGDGIVSHVFEVFSPIVKYDIAFMKHYIHNERVMHNILLHSTTKTLMMNTLNSKEFLQQIILLPTLPEQQKIGALFTKLDHLIALQNHKLELLQELKKGYLQKMFI